MTRPRRISSPRDKALLASPVRQNLLDTLCAARTATARELAAEMGMRPSALYYHIELLERAGLVRRRPARRDDARREAVFAPAAESFLLEHELGSEPGRRASERLIRALLRAAARDAAVGLRSPLARPRTPGRNLWGSRMKAWLDDREIAAVDRHLVAIERLMLRSRRGPGKLLVAASWLVAPVSRERAGGRP